MNRLAAGEILPPFAFSGALSRRLVSRRDHSIGIPPPTGECRQFFLSFAIPMIAVDKVMKIMFKVYFQYFSFDNYFSPIQEAMVSPMTFFCVSSETPAFFSFIS